VWQIVKSLWVNGLTYLGENGADNKSGGEE